MQFVKNFVEHSIGCAGGDGNVNAIIDNMDLYHSRVWKQFSLMPIEKLSRNKESPILENRQFTTLKRAYSSPKSLLLPPASPNYSSLKPSCSPPQSLRQKCQLLRTKVGEMDAHPNHEENVSLALYDAKCKLYQLEQCILSSTTDPNYERNINIDKLALLFENNDKVVAELKAELLSRQASFITTQDKLGSVLVELQTTSASIESATDALKSLSELLTCQFYQCINLVDIDQLLNTLAKQLRLFWLVHFPNLFKKGPNSTFESQLDEYVEALFIAIVDACQINSTRDYSTMISNASLQAFVTLFESFLPYLAVADDQNNLKFNVNSVTRCSNLLNMIETGLVSQYSLINSNNINSLPQVRVTVALLKLLCKYSFQAINKPATDLPPFDYPAIYANELGKMLNNAKNLLMSKLFLNHASTFLLEIYEIFEIYSGFKIYDNPFGLNSVLKFLDAILSSLNDSIWNYMGPLELKLRSQNIESKNTELWKYISKKYPYKGKEKEKDEPSTMEITEMSLASSSTSLEPLPPPPAESPLTTRIERIHSPTIDIDTNEKGKDDNVPIEFESIQSTPLKKSLSFGTSVSWLKSLKSTIHRRISGSKEETSGNTKRKLSSPEIIDLDDSVPDSGSPKLPDSSETVEANISPNKKHKSADDSESKTVLTKPLFVIDLEAKDPTTSQLTSPPSLASSAAEAVRQSSQLAPSSSKDAAPSESDQLKMQVLHLQKELSQMGKQFDRLMEKLNRKK